MKKPTILEVQHLSVVYTTDHADLPVLREISLEIQQGQVYGLVGESGSGKTTLGLSIMRYLPLEGRVIGGKIKLAGRDLLPLPKSELRDVWGKQITLVPQDPYTSLNPSIRVGEQLAEVFHKQSEQSKEAAAQKAIGWLERVRLPDPQQIARKYPHEMSGGQKQRILVAMALSNQPQLLVLDEPTTSLDVTTEAVILDLLCDLIQAEGTSALFITHNLGIVAGLTDRVAVLYAGEMVEDAPTKTLYQQPLHPYTHGLLNSVPKLGMHKEKAELPGMSGQIPPLSDLPSGCVFAPRCGLATELCHQERPPLEYPNDNRSIRCHRWREILAGEITFSTEEKQALSTPSQQAKAVLQVKDLEVHYQVSSSGIGSLLGKKETFKAVDRVSLQVGQSRTLGIVGESGSGKSSLALGVMGLIDASNGDINLLNIQLPRHLHQRDKGTLSKLQMVFQNLDEAFSPYLTVEEILSRPLRNLLGLDKAAAQQRVAELLEMVRLPVEYRRRYPHQLSGGEKQRIAIAQAFAANPDLLIADEPVSALDVSIQASILNLLSDLQREHQTASLLISHDIAVVNYLADEVAVMYLGQVMQFSVTKQLLSPPFHPYTEALLSAVPVADPTHISQTIQLEGDIPSPLEKPSGCPFHTRCPRVIGSICRHETPPWQTTTEGKRIFCHIPLKELPVSQKEFQYHLTGEEG
jgi:peptide/nickel transport system ATP-binding protein